MCTPKKILNYRETKVFFLMKIIILFSVTYFKLEITFKYLLKKLHFKMYKFINYDFSTLCIFNVITYNIIGTYIKQICVKHSFI